MRQLVQKHMECETNLDLEGVLGTLVDHPVYEFYPLRLKLEGKENIRKFYREHFDTFFPKIKSHKLINEWWGPETVCMEYDLWLNEAPLDRAYRILVVLSAKGPLLNGERFYAEEELVRLMTGNTFSGLVKF
jgi:hypothetical protein